MDLWIRNRLQQNNDPRKASHFYAPTKSYLNIPPEEQQSFWTTYCSAVKDGLNPLIYECVRTKGALQLGYDIKLAFERQQVPSRSEVISTLTQTIDQYVQHITGVIQTMIGHYFEVTDQGSEFIACYLKRDDENLLTWGDNTIDYMGRIIFPYARVGRGCVSGFYHLVLSQLQLHGRGPDQFLSIPPINGLDTLIRPIDDDLIEMYGSSSGEEHPPLRLYESYGFLNTDVRTTFDLSKVFSPTLHTSVSQGIFPQDVVASKIEEHGIDYLLPLFFSSGFYDMPMDIREGFPLAETQAPKITMSVIKDGGTTLGELERARRLLTYLSLSRVEEYWSWIDIGKALHSVDPDKEGLRLWKWVTSQSDFKSEDDCETMWPMFDDHERVTIETLEYFASIDNPDKYEMFRDKEIREAVNLAIRSQNHTPVAKAFKACFPHVFVCSNYEKGVWYYYNKHRWNRMDGTSTLRWYINEVFQPKIQQIQADIASKIANSRDTEFKSRNQSTIEMICELIKKLSNDGFNVSLCRVLKVYYRYLDTSFGNLSDKNPHYMATPSGVIDLRGGKAVVRPGKPQDYITKSTRHAYPTSFTWETSSVSMVVEYVKQIFRSRSLRRYFWRLGSSLLLSGNIDKIFPAFLGAGNNSKSMLVRLFEAAFGSYAVKLPTSLLTGKETSADSATPTLIHSEGAKVAFLEEPNKREVIQSGTVKKLTGHDTVYVRDLFQKGCQIVELDVTIVPILIANKIPSIPDCQQAIWGRMRVIDFLSTWCSDAPERQEEQFRQGKFRMDKFFDRKIPVMAPAFLWILVQKYEKYYNEGLQDPPEVLQATENFRVANNFYIHFTRDSIKQVLTGTGDPDLTAFVTLDELFNTFRRWYSDQQFRAKVPNKTEFKENIENIWKQKADGENKWYGLQLNNQASTIQSLLSV